MSSVSHSLSQTLARHRIVFWYDANKEFKDEYESYEEPRLNKVVLN